MTGLITTATFPRNITVFDPSSLPRVFVLSPPSQTGQPLIIPTYPTQVALFTRGLFLAHY
jgi:hypothetical protein